MTELYASMAELKARLDISDNDDDAILGGMLEAVSRSIDSLTHTRFYSTAADETRYFTATCDDVLWVGHIQSITTLKTDADGDRTYEDSWTEDTDFDLLPYNAALDGLPYDEIQTTPQGNYSFPAGVAKGVEIIGKFGYSTSAPPAIREATLLICEKLFLRKDAVFGVMGVTELGVVQRIIKDDPELTLLLAPFMPSPAPRMY